jgi:hypothetical protein
MAMTHRRGWINRFVRWLFGAPFEHLPPEFGNTVPPELCVFETEAELAQRTEQREPVTPTARDGRDSPARWDHWIERQ